MARLAGRGSNRAFAAVYERYHQPLYRCCRSILRNDADAQDALQSTFMRALSALQRDQRSAPLRPWLFRIAHNESISLLRRRGNHEPLAGDSMPLVASAEDQAAEQARFDALIEDLATLPDRPRGALIMRELGGLSHEEIAIALDTTPGAAKQAIFEARTGLHELSEGRAMPCDDVCRAISDGDRRVLRGRRVRAHLRSCEACAAFARSIDARQADLRALAPALPAAASVAVLARALHGAAAAPAGTAGSSGATGVAGAAGSSSSSSSGAAGVASAAGSSSSSSGAAGVAGGTGSSAGSGVAGAAGAAGKTIGLAAAASKGLATASVLATAAVSVGGVAAVIRLTHDGRPAIGGRSVPAMRSTGGSYAGQPRRGRGYRLRHTSRTGYAQNPAAAAGGLRVSLPARWHVPTRGHLPARFHMPARERGSGFSLHRASFGSAGGRHRLAFTRASRVEPRRWVRPEHLRPESVRPRAFARNTRISRRYAGFRRAHEARSHHTREQAPDLAGPRALTTQSRLIQEAR